MIAACSLLLVPLALALAHLVEAPPLWLFLVGVLAIVPLAEWIRRATEQLARIAGSAVGGLLNVTFGNTAELVLALFVLSAGHPDVVKAQITGSIIGNCLLGLGVAILVGSRGRASQRFGRERAGMLSSLLILSLIGLLVPAVFAHAERGALARAEATTLVEKFSLGVAAVLLIVYVANLLYTLGTHRDAFARDDAREGGGVCEGEAASDDGAGGDEESTWSLARALATLLVATIATALMADVVSASLQASADALGVTTFFLGITVLAIIGNAAEYVSAAYFAARDRMSLVLAITVGSSIQIALLVTPLLVIVSFFIGAPMNLVFRPLELAAIAAAAFAVNAIALDGETTWFEGLLLVAVYLIAAVAFFFLTP